MDGGEENLGELVVTRGDGSEMLELVEKTLNEIAFAVEGEVARARGFSVGFGRDDGDDRSIVEGGDEGVGVERLVGDQGAGIDGFDERLSASQIVILARAEHHLDRIAEGVDECVNLGGQSAAGSADSLRPSFFGRRRYVRRIIYTTNAIEALNAKLRRAVRTRGHFPTDDAATMLLFLVLRQAAGAWKMNRSGIAGGHIV